MRVERQSRSGSLNTLCGCLPRFSFMSAPLACQYACWKYLKNRDNKPKTCLREPPSADCYRLSALSESHPRMALRVSGTAFQERHGTCFPRRSAARRGAMRSGVSRPGSRVTSTIATSWASPSAASERHQEDEPPG